MSEQKMLLTCIGTLIVLNLIGNRIVLADLPMSQEVRCAEIKFSLSAENRDRDQFIKSIDADARFVSASVYRGPDEIVRAWAPFFEAGGPRIKWRPQYVEVLASGDLALSRGPYRIETREEDGSLTVGWGTFNSIWRRNQQGHWRVVFDAGNIANELPADGVQSILEEPDLCDDLN